MYIRCNEVELGKLLCTCFKFSDENLNKPFFRLIIIMGKAHFRDCANQQSDQNAKGLAKKHYETKNRLCFGSLLEHSLGSERMLK